MRRRPRDPSSVWTTDLVIYLALAAVALYFLSVVIDWLRH